MNISEVVQEIIDGEEVDRDTPAEVIAGINAAMQEIEQLRILNSTHAAVIFSLHARIDRMLEVATGEFSTVTERAVDILAYSSMAGSHNERNQNALKVAQQIVDLMMTAKYGLIRLRAAARGATVSGRIDNDEIPF